MGRARAVTVAALREARRLGYGLGVLEIEPVETFLEHCPADAVTRVGGPELELTPGTLPGSLHVYVLEQSR